MTDKVRLFHLPFSFMLPQKVAVEKGYFEAEGLQVELVERDRGDVDWKYIPAEESLTDDHGVDIYPICKWESIKRTWEMDDGRIVGKGTFANQPYTVYVREESDIADPSDLANVPVGVNKRTGQEYTVIRALENHMPSDAVTLEHHGMPTDRLRALRDGDVEAVSLLEPQSTLAEKLGFRPVLQFENHMGIVGADAVDGSVLEKFIRGYERAASDINEQPAAYRDAYLEMLRADADVAPDLFDDIEYEALLEDIEVPRYESPEVADREELSDHLSWMKRRQLVDESADIDAIVAPIER
ncbi:ABC transporter substrate-binding protein [Natrinema sp. SYSU A 869]|uniref:ABC transporter substrate-binding protein n=1 Tax=Natrinema sp. SYSU A 869 TaxID=2871694 RepID=UPI001CA42E67|nr:ABC transporter substrate-binding protein [Natrinema sp. SYSU A 869]